MKKLNKIAKMNKVGLIWIVAWIVIFLLDLTIGLKEQFCCKGFDILGTEYYRLFTGLLLHVNLFHIVANVMGMYYVCVFLNGKVNNYVLFLFSIVTGTIANTIFAAINRQSYMIGGSPMVFALIGFIVIMQWKRKDLPRFRLGTWYGNWIVGYATLGNLPFFSKDGSTLVIHMMGLATGAFFSFFLIKRKAAVSIGDRKDE